MSDFDILYFFCSSSSSFFEEDILKGSYDAAKKNIILCIWCNAICLCGLKFKKHIIFHILYIIVAPLSPAFLKRFKARHVLSQFMGSRSHPRSVVCVCVCVCVCVQVSVCGSV